MENIHAKRCSGCCKSAQVQQKTSSWERGPLRTAKYSYGGQHPLPLATTNSSGRWQGWWPHMALHGWQHQC